MRASAAIAARLGRLLTWDSPFLPEVDRMARVDGDVELTLRTVGEPLADLAGSSESRRLSVAVQLVVAASFLYERGWVPARALLRGARVTAGRDGVHVRLGGLPRARLEHRWSRRAVLDETPNLPARAVLPILAWLLPARRDEFEAAVRRAPSGQGVEALLEVLQPRGWSATVLRHPEGRGRFLWARRLSFPDEGVVWVEEPAVAGKLAVAAALARPDLVVAAGALDSGAVARAQTQATMRGVPCLVLTTLPSSEASPLALDGGEESIWVAGRCARVAMPHVVHAVEHGKRRAAVAAHVLAAGAASGFACRPVAASLGVGRESMASTEARRALDLLAAVRVGMSAEEVEAVSGSPLGSLEELERLGLAWRGAKTWHAVRPGGSDGGDWLRAAVEKLPVPSRTHRVAAALALNQWNALVTWCEERLEAEDPSEVMAIVRALPDAALALVGAEAALLSGHLGDARRFLEMLAVPRRDARWHALQAWWAERVDRPLLAREALARAPVEDLPRRLGVRRLMTAAELAHARQEREKERTLLQQALVLAGGGAVEAELLLASLDGAEGIRALRRRGTASWTADQRALALHLLAIHAFRRDETTAAGTALRAALRANSGENPLLLGGIYGDLAVVHILQDRAAAAERYLRLAEVALERAGSEDRRDAMRSNRAVLANDRLDWRQARELLEANAATHDRPARAAALDRMELARASLVRGEWEALRSEMPELEALAEEHRGVEYLGEALHGLKAFLRLAEGDVAAAAEEGRGAEAETTALVNAVERAAGGVDPPNDLPERWGMAALAQVLAAWRRGDRATAAVCAQRALARAPLPSALGLACLLAVLRRAGEEPDEGLSTCLRAAESTLVDGALSGWAELVRRYSGMHLPRVVRAVKGIVLAGTDCTSVPRLAELCASLGISGVQVVRGNGAVVRWGRTAAGEEHALVMGGVEVRWHGAGDEAVREVMELLAGYVASQPCLTFPEADEGGSILVGRSAALAAVRELMARWGPLPIRVLITGEPGTGKELVARELHRLSGRRGAFVAVNCAGIPATLLERELFGSVRGAYSGAEDTEGLVEAAEAGTLLLDEIGELPVEMQAKLLRLLQDREVRRVGSTRSRTVDVRFVAATNRDLQAAVASGSFRADLYHRIAVAHIHVPPLREHLEDIDDLAPLFARHCAREYDRHGVTLAPATLVALRRWSWPGNVRELEYAVHKAVSLARPGEVLGPDRFPFVAAVADGEAPAEGYTEAKRRFERSYFTRLLRLTGGNRSEAARRAGITRQALLYHLRNLGDLDD